VNSSDVILGETRGATDRGAGTCVGKPVPSIDVAIIGIDDGPVEAWSEELRRPDGEVGEIVVKGPQVTREYFDADKHNRFGKIPDGDDVRHRMGDLGYFDEQGRLWFCGRMSQRVITPEETLYTVPCESVFNTHADVYRSALVSAEVNGEIVPVICIEAEPSIKTGDHERIRGELLELGATFEHTRSIGTVLFHRSFPVDIRHNVKIGRRALGDWATAQLRRT
jgi:acyl-CoA synthetase (AMP-forming)/AMP-acid ligase II